MKGIKYTAVILLLLTGGKQLKAQRNAAIADTFHIAGTGGWDYLAVHGEELYVSHGTQVNILHKLTGDSIGTIPNTIGVHGIAFDDAIHKGFTSNGRLNNVFIFDGKTHQVLDSISTGKNPDAILYEPFSKKIITCNGRSNDLSVIDPLLNKLVATIPVPGKPETAVSDGNGQLFVNIEDKNEIVAIDLAAGKIVATWPLDGAEGPTGLCYDATTKRLFAGCDQLLVVLDAVSGKVIDKIVIGGGCDGVAFDSQRKMIFTSNGQDGTMTVIKEGANDKYKVLANHTTVRSARTITIDESTHTLYLPCAEMGPVTTKGERPKMLPGTFRVLVIKE